MTNSNNTLTNLGTLAVDIAVGQIGQMENPKGSNRGPMVDQYLQSVGLHPGYAWCMSFVYWCYLEAARAMLIDTPVVKTGGVLNCWNLTSASKKLTMVEAISRPELIVPGTQFIMEFGHGTGHTGIVERVERTDKGVVLHTIEGNSNNDGSREGYEVVRHVRNIDARGMKGFIRY